MDFIDESGGGKQQTNSWAKIELTKQEDRSTFFIEDNIYSLSVKCYVYTLYINSCLIHSTFNIGFLMRLFHQQLNHRRAKKTAPRGPETWKTTSDNFFRRLLCDLFKPGTETKACGQFLCEGFFLMVFSNISAKRKWWEQIFWSRWWFLKMMRYVEILSELRNRWLYSATTWNR